MRYDIKYDYNNDRWQVVDTYSRNCPTGYTTTDRQHAVRMAKDLDRGKHPQ
jgi:hypothetical protein